MSNRTPLTTSNSGETAVTYLEPALWKQLQDAESIEDFCFSWLRLQCKMIREVTSGVVLLGSNTQKQFEPVAYWPQSFSFHEKFSTVIDRLLQEKKGVVLRSQDAISDSSKENAHQQYHLAYPIQIRDSLAGLIAIELTDRSTTDLQSAMRQLQWGTAWIKFRLADIQLEPDAVVRKRLMSVFDITAISLQEPRFKAAATKLVTELASKLDCDRVSIGFSQNDTIQVAALSHSAKFDTQTNLIRSIGNTMDECLDQGETLIYPQTEQQQDAILLAHAEHTRLHGSPAICSVPLLDSRANGFGVLCLESNRPFDTESTELCEAIAALSGPSLDDKRRNDRILPLKIADSLNHLLAMIFGKGHTTLKTCLFLLAALTLFFSYYESDYRVTAVTTLKGTIQRSVTSPFDGFLDSVHVKAGDLVYEGDILAELNTRDLRLEQIKISSEEEQRLLEYNKALAENEIALSSIILEQINQSRTQISLLQQQIERARITAPLSGVLISGDLDQSIGAPIQRGEVLFQVAPLDSYRVVVEVDEKDIEQIVTDLQGELVLNALPEDILPFTIDKITPVSSAREGRNFFIAEGHLLETSDRLRPGMQGYGKIHVDRRKLIWIWTHGMTDWFRLKTWSWLP